MINFVCNSFAKFAGVAFRKHVKSNNIYLLFLKDNGTMN